MAEPALHPLVGGFRDAENYDRARPRYGPAVAAALLEALGLRPGDPVLELGAGTGQLTEALLGAGLELTAVEPLARTRALLARVIGPERVLDGVAEAIPLPDRSVAAVFAADAFHWFDPGRAMPEIGRVLGSGGGIAVLRSLPAWEGPWADELGRLIAASRPHHPAFDAGGAAAVIEATGEYSAVRRLKVMGEQRTDRALILAYIASFSWVGALARDERERLLGAAEAVLERHQVGEVRHPVAHHAWVARRTL